jgi:hypothetical protein
MQRTEANVDRVQALVCWDRRLDVRLRAEESNIFKETVRQTIYGGFGNEVSAKMVLQILPDYQKQCRVRISSDLLHSA